MRTHMLFALGVVSLAVVSLSAQVASPPAADAELLPLIGLWRTGTDAGVSTFTVDGTAAPKPNEESARQYFGAAGATFVAAASTPTVFPLAASPAVRGFTAGTVSVQFKLIAGATDQTAGIAFNIRPDHSYLYARYNTKDGNVALWKYERGERTVLAHGDRHEPVPFDVWHTLTVNISGRQVSATVNDTFRVAHMIDRDVNGGAGLWTKADSVTAFRRFAVLDRPGD